MKLTSAAVVIGALRVNILPSNTEPIGLDLRCRSNIKGNTVPAMTRN